MQRKPLCPRLHGLQFCTILEKNDHVFERFCEILSKVDTRLANRKPKKKSLLHIVFKTFVDFFSKLKKKCKLFTKYSNSYGISFVILQQSALCSQQDRLSLWAILTKCCKFWICFSKTSAKFYTSLWNSKLKWTRQTQIIFQNICYFFFQIHKKNCKRFGNAPIHQQFPMFLCSKRRCVRG